MSQVWLEIINPSDKAHIEGSDLLAAQVAILTISKGTYALEDEKGETVLPFFMFGGLEAWVEANIEGGDLSAWIGHNRSRLAKALRTVTYGSRAECESQALALSLIETEENRQKFIAENEDKRRSSLSQIVNACHSWAQNLERAEEVKA